jgi:hypothetical protein
MTTSGRIQGGFETQSGASNFVTTQNAYNDGQWHYVVLTYDGGALRIYLDGTEVNFVDEHSTPLSTTEKPLKVGSNALVLSNFFSGEIDEVRIWDHSIMPKDVADQYNDQLYSGDGLVLHLPFS